ncbi:hypothetical protein BDP27DRAFT_1255089, partial [Rhodocollybia butyracea]
MRKAFKKVLLKHEKKTDNSKTPIQTTPAPPDSMGTQETSPNSASMFAHAHNFTIHGSQFNNAQNMTTIQTIYNEGTPLTKLPYSWQAFHDCELGVQFNRKSCAEGTRVQILEDIEKWATSPISQSSWGYWMCGMAGTGKSTIAKSTCLLLEEKGILAGSFFCSRQIPECRDYRLIIPTLAYQLAQYSETYGMILKDVLIKNPDISTKSPRDQIPKLLVDPWNIVCKAGHQEINTPVFVIDGLDEC